MLLVVSRRVLRVRRVRVMTASRPVKWSGAAHAAAALPFSNRPVDDRCRHAAFIAFSFHVWMMPDDSASDLPEGLACWSLSRR